MRRRVWPLLILAVTGAALSAPAAASEAPATIRGELRVERPERRRARGAPLKVHATITLEPGSPIRKRLRFTVVTDTQFTLHAPAAVYRISAHIDPPTVRPKARPCSKATIRARSGGLTRVTLTCTLTS